MAFFGKDKIPEIEASKGFVHHIAERVKSQWSEIADELLKIFPAEKSNLDNELAPVEFLLAVIAVQIQALPNLLPKNQATRIREHIMQGISDPALGDYPRKAIQEYQMAWDQALQVNEDPTVSIASVLYDKIGLQSSHQLGEASFKSPILLTFLSSTIVSLGGPWWKMITEKFKLVP